jgi:hypothetical protein
MGSFRTDGREVLACSVRLLTILSRPGATTPSSCCARLKVSGSSSHSLLQPSPQPAGLLERPISFPTPTDRSSRPQRSLITVRSSPAPDLVRVRARQSGAACHAAAAPASPRALMSASASFRRKVEFKRRTDELRDGEARRAELARLTERAERRAALIRHHWRRSSGVAGGPRAPLGGWRRERPGGSFASLLRPGQTIG